MGEHGLAQSEQPYTQSRRLGAYSFMFGVPLLFGYLAVRIAASAWPLSLSLIWFQLPLLTISGILMGIAVWLVISPLRRKFKTGKFLLSGAEAAQKAAESWNRFGAGKPLRPQVWLWLLPALFSAFLLWIAGLGIAAVWCGSASSRGQQIALVALTTALLAGGLAYPFIGIQRKIRTGSFLPSQEELAARRARCAKPASLKKRLLTSATWWVSAILWTDVAAHSNHYGAISPWFTAGLMWITAALWTFRFFRPTASQCASPTPGQTPGTPSQN